MKKIFLLCGLPVLIYFLGAILIFDFTHSVDQGEAGDCAGQEISVGPDIRLIPSFISPPHDYDFPAGGIYTGDEWLYRLYEPVCQLWRRQNGYIASWECPE